MTNPRRRKGHGRALRLIRNRLGWYQPRMARLLGLNSKTLVSQWERGIVSPPLRVLYVYAVLARRVGMEAVARVLELADGIHKPPACVTALDIAAIQRRCADGELQRAVGADYGLSQSSVSKIVNWRRTW